MSRALNTVAVLAIAFTPACDSSTAPEPEPEIPNIEGTWDYVAPLDGFQGTNWTGTLTIFHAGGETFSGSWSIALATPQEVGETFSGQITQGTINADGEVHLRFLPEFRHDGRVQGGSMTGTWLFAGQDENFSGTFTASRRF